MSLPDYAIAGAPDLTLDQFAALLRDAGSPATPEATHIYAALKATGVRPSVWLAFGWVESKLGREGVIANFETRNMGNVRSPESSALGTVIDTPRGEFARYANWADGALDWGKRLTGPKYAGRGLLTVRQVLPVYAPSGDSNDPDAYARTVLQKVTEWVGGTTVAQIADRADLAWTGDNRPGTPLRGFHACVAHETANESAGANAEMHRKFVRNGGGPDGASFHLVADKDESIQLLTTGEVGYHIGDGANDPDDEAFFTVGGEICVNDRAGYPAACRNMAQAFARVLKEMGRPVIDGVTLRQHGSYWSPRNPQVHQGCPQHLKARDWGVSWAQFVGMVTEELAALSLAPAPVGEAANQRLLFDTVAREYPGDEAARYLGTLVREGKLLAKAAGFGKSDVERVAIYQKGALHTLGGYVYAFFDEAAAAVDPALAPATVAGLLANGYIVLYQ